MTLSVADLVRRNFFRDSLQLMKLTEEAKKLPDVEDAVVAMGTETNKRLLQDLGLLGHEGSGAGEGDLILAVRVVAGSDAAGVLGAIERMVDAPPQTSSGQSALTFHSIESALENFPGVNLAVVSVPGSQAFEPTMALLHRGVHVHLFSDHVPKEQEMELKRYASSKGLLVLGPGAGTSIVDGVGLGFANAVRRGNVGIVASAGTGIQEVSVLLDEIGLGVSHALGVGGSDVSEEIGGLMMKDCLGLLERDSATSVVMIVAKAPAEKVMREVMGYVEGRTKKPVVACFLGLKAQPSSQERVHYAKTLHAGVLSAARVAGGDAPRRFDELMSAGNEELIERARGLSSTLGRGQRHIRGLYSGGTLAHETLLILKELVSEPHSNTPLSRGFELADPSVSKEDSIVDLGDEFFTSGRAHPMIDPTLRRLRIVQEAKDPSVAVIMLDVVLGYGSASDPGGALVSAVEEAKAIAKKEGRELIVMAHVCGTVSDPQSLERQSESLSNAGVVLFPSNAEMAVVAALVVGGEKASARLRSGRGELLG